MFAILGSKLAFMLYGAALGWAATHWTVVKTTETSLLKLLGNKKVTETAPAAPPAGSAPPPSGGPPV
jgi:hypothetical protein